jgi:hypothetical protein
MHLRQIGVNDLGHSLMVVNNRLLLDLPRLGSLQNQELTGGLVVVGNALLPRMGGVSTVKDIGGSLIVKRNEHMVAMDMQSLVTIGGDLVGVCSL